MSNLNGLNQPHIQMMLAAVFQWMVLTDKEEIKVDDHISQKRMTVTITNLEGGESPDDEDPYIGYIDQILREEDEEDSPTVVEKADKPSPSDETSQLQRVKNIVTVWADTTNPSQKIHVIFHDFFVQLLYSQNCHKWGVSVLEGTNHFSLTVEQGVDVDEATLWLYQLVQKAMDIKYWYVTDDDENVWEVHCPNRVVWLGVMLGMRGLAQLLFRTKTSTGNEMITIKVEMGKEAEIIKKLVDIRRNSEQFKDETKITNS